MPGGRRNAASRTGPIGRSGNTYTSLANVNGRNNSGERAIGNSTDDKKIDEIYGGKSLTPKHVPIPVIPVDEKLTFEVLSLFVSIIVTCLQLLNIYKTVWWLPHSYNGYSVNMYLIDPYMLLFIFITMACRVIYILLCKFIVLLPIRWQHDIYQIMRTSLLTCVISIIGWCLYHMAERHDFMKLFYYICYLSCLIYLLAFGESLDISTSFSSKKEERKTKYLLGKYLLDKPLHNCSLNASAIRAEVSALRSDFNERLKQVLFSSFNGAYICGVAPIIFVPPHLYFNLRWVVQHAFLFFLVRISAYIAEAYPVRYCDVLHRAALHLGRWIKIENRNNHAYAQSWNEMVLWPHGSVVRHNRKIYRSEGLCTAAEPGNLNHYRFHVLFNNPTMLLCSLLILQILLVTAQLIILLHTPEWCQVLSITLLLIINYYTLFKVTRDYLICWKIYRAEQIIQEKSQMVVNPIAQ